MGIKSFLRIDDNLMEAFNITDENLVLNYACDNYDENEFSESKHRFLTGQALHLVERMILRGEYKYAEIQGAVEHLFVCIKAKKLHLDMEKSKKINQIDKLIECYPKSYINEMIFKRRNQL